MKNYFILNLQFLKNFYLMLGYSLTMINNVVIVSGGQQRDSAIYMCVCMCVCVCMHSPTNSPPTKRAHLLLTLSCDIHL